MDIAPKIRLAKYHWYSGKTVSVTGFAWLHGQYISGKAFQSLVSRHTDSAQSIKKFACGLNGQFSFVVKKENEVWLACSHTWSYPIFYFQQKNEITISDDPDFLLAQISHPIVDTFSKKYFLMFGVTPQNNTLFQQIYQVKPGEIIFLKKGLVKFFPFFEGASKNPLQKVGEEKLQQSILILFEKYFNYLKDKPVLLPLTSGYDSRLLACLFKEFGHKNVLCATWGRKGNAEIETALKVAKKLGYKHLFIEYNADLVSGFSAKDTFLDYARFAGHFSSMPFLQDYFAIDFLKKNKIITSETVAMPGYSGDYFAGSHLDTNIGSANYSHLLSRIINKYSAFYPLSTKALKEIKRHIQKYFFENEGFEPWQNYEMWDFQERQCKFISNANHAWFYFGIETVMPLFDKEFIEFFKPIPLEQKAGALFYNKTLENYFFKPHKVDFHFKSKTQASAKFNVFKKLVLQIAPTFIKKIYYPLKDDIYYREITEELKNSSGKPFSKTPIKPNAYNSYIIQWYLHFLNL